jgi:L-asparaginase
LQVFGRKIVVLGTGGTIAGTVAQGSGGHAYRAAQIGIEDLLKTVPGLPGMGLELQTEQVAQIDSKDMDFVVWQRLLQRCRYWLAHQDVMGLVLTHGTDTLEETAFLLQTVLAPGKPLVITCAMRAATAVDADGPQNLKDALALAAHPGAQGVLVVCAGQIHCARDVQKVHPTRLDPFSSGEAGPLGQIVAGQVRMRTGWPQPENAWSDSAVEKLAQRTSPWPRVEIVFSHAGASGALVDALVLPGLAKQLGAQSVQGLIVAATGNGTVHRELESALLRAQSAGLQVLRATRCCLGSVHGLSNSPLPDSGGLIAVKARLALMLTLLLREGAAT